MAEMSAAGLITRAATCRRCGKVHEYRAEGMNYHTWLSPDDGHLYDPFLPTDTIAELLVLARMTTPPWVMPASALT